MMKIPAGLIVAFIQRWDARDIPFAAATERGITGCNDGDIKPGVTEKKMPDAICEAVRLRREAYAAVSGGRKVRRLMTDFEGNTLARKVLPSVLPRLRKENPGIIFGHWGDQSPELFDAIRGTEDEWIPEIYCHARTEIPLARVSVAINGFLKTAGPDVWILPCAGVEIGYLHPDFKNDPSREPLVSAEDVSMRSAVVLGAARSLKQIRGIGIWGGARSDDQPRVDAIARIGEAVARNCVSAAETAGGDGGAA